MVDYSSRSCFVKSNTVYRQLNLQSTPANIEVDSTLNEMVAGGMGGI